MGNCTLLLENMTRSFSSKECPTFPFFSPDGSLHSVSIQTLPGYLSILSLFHRVVYLSTRRISSSLLACSAQSLPFALLKLNTDYNSMREEEGENGLARKECPSFPFFYPLSWTDPCVEYTRQIDSPTWILSLFHKVDLPRVPTRRRISFGASICKIMNLLLLWIPAQEDRE